MWADNETEEDLLGFDFVVDSLFVALTEPRLLPLTIGLLGDWGSGKSSVLKIVNADLEALNGDDEGDTGQYVCVEFSPWQYEDYDDIKVALMGAVLDRLQQEVTDEAEQVKVSWLRRHVPGFRRRGRSLGRYALTAAPAVAAATAGLVDPSLVSPELIEAGKSVVGMAATAGEQALEDSPSGADTDLTAEPVAEVGAFKQQFTDLVNNLEHVSAVVVLIDDLDRCLPESVVDTFEAIRLFLNSPKTAFVVAANQLVVESAIDSRYPELRRPDGTGIGADYLEKMLQLKVTIPALSPAEAETYMNLLLAELRLPREQFTLVLGTVRQRRADNPLGIGFNLGVAEDCLGAGNIPQQLIDDLEWATRISQSLVGGLRGNPRQLKRFLNNVMLRARSARRRRVELDLAVIAKLLVLEEQHFGDFKRLFDWQMASAGAAEQLQLAETVARSTTRGGGADDVGAPPASPHTAADESVATRPGGRAGRRSGTPQPGSDLPSEVKEWVAREHVFAWLRDLEPPLAGLDLRPYFTYSRDKLSLGVVVARLAPRLQELLGNLQSDIDALRRAALDAAQALPPEERDQVVQALLDAAVRAPAGRALLAAAELAGRMPETAPGICEALMQVPVNAIPPLRATTAIRHLPKGNAAVDALLNRWQHSGVPALERAVTAARAQATRARR